MLQLLPPTIAPVLRGSRLEFLFSFDGLTFLCSSSSVKRTEISALISLSPGRQSFLGFSAGIASQLHGTCDVAIIVAVAMIVVHKQCSIIQRCRRDHHH